jgi:Alr-MurF fusion protein
MYSIAEIEKIIDGKFLLQKDADAVVEHLLIDSRKLLFPSSTLFFTIPGPRRQGNAFVKDLYYKGVRNFIVDKSFVFLPDDYPEANIILAENVLAALQQLTAAHRQQFTIPVIGITGSNGKTIVKEWLYQLLQSDYTIKCVANEYNAYLRHF